MTPPETNPTTLANHLIMQAIEQLSEINVKLGEMRGDMGSLKSSVDRLAPLVDKHEEQHNRAVGAMHFGKWIWTVIAGGTGAALASALQWIVGAHPGQHP